MIQDSLKVAVNEAVEQTGASSSESLNWWMWIAIAQFGFILYLLFRQASEPNNNIRKQFKKESLSQEIDFDNVLKSSFHANALYDLLKVKCHPDRFPDVEKNKVADALFQEITRNKRNLKKLTELKLQAEKKLNINF